MSEFRPNPDPDATPPNAAGNADGRNVDARSAESLWRESGPILSEDALLDWVDGRVSAADAAALAGASGRRGLATRVTQMQANKRALAGLPLERAPADLAERVVQALEREALLALSDGQSTGSLPISMYQEPVRGRRRNAGPSWRFPLAMAAGLALILGGVSFMAYNVLGPKGSSTVGPLATNDASEPVGVLSTPEVAESTRPVGEAFAQAMRAPGDDSTAMVADSGTVGTFGVSNGDDAGGDTPVAGTESGRNAAQAKATTIDDARALELARERRLAVRVRGASTRSLALLAQNNGRVWTLEPGMDEGTKLALDTERQGRYDAMIGLAKSGDGFGLAVSTEDRTRLALRSLGGVAPISIQPPAAVMMTPAPSIAYTADLPDGASSLLSLKATLAARLGGSVSYVELDAPQPVDPVAAAMRTLWWTEPSSAWSPRVRVPVYIEPLQ